VHYTERGSVLLGVRRVGDALRVEVHDTGAGIAPEQQQAIFEEFRRGDGASGQGLGLGLAIADRIAQLLDAPLTLRSDVDVGTMFALTLPRSPMPAAATSSTSSRGGLAGTRVLVVDNETPARSGLRQLLEGMGCLVHDAADGVGADSAMRDSPAELWLFDYHLDAGDTGVAVYERLSAAHGARPAVILSADAGPQVRAAVHEAGLPLLMKPLKPLALKSVLDRLLAARAVR
jgi:CheY-like chemotaxis protein